MAFPELPPHSEILLYQTEDGHTRIDCRFQDETLWLSQALIAELFDKDVRTINEHLQNIFEEGELDPEATIRKFRIVRREGNREVGRLIEHYSLDAILAVGYRVRSPRGTQFRRWATERLREYLVKGFTMDDERLKNPPVEGSGVPDYFDELLEKTPRKLARPRRRNCLRKNRTPRNRRRAMKLHFEANLDYQLAAIGSVCDLFRGQETCRTAFTVTREFGGGQAALAGLENDLGIGNRLTLLDDEILANLTDVQLRNGLRPSDSLDSGDFTVEMETGTGKTYVYLRTIFELNRRYGFTKFVIVVPSVAIKEGVYQRPIDGMALTVSRFGWELLFRPLCDGRAGTARKSVRECDVGRDGFPIRPTHRAADAGASFTGADDALDPQAPRRNSPWTLGRDDSNDLVPLGWALEAQTYQPGPEIDWRTPRR